MSSRLKKKSAALAVVIVVALVAAGVVLGRMQQRLSYGSYTTEIEQCRSELPGAS